VEITFSPAGARRVRERLGEVLGHYEEAVSG
jgi:hypothetical protein